MIEVKFAFDSNVVVYAEGVNDPYRQLVANRLAEAVGNDDLIVPLQALGEAVRAMVRKLGVTAAEAVARMRYWCEAFATQDTNREVFDGAVELVLKHKFQFWDAVIMSAAAAGGASVLFSEDMHDGFVWRDVMIVNPFAETRHPVVELLLKPTIN
jgi:predicted nucleic acid-binding protein